jgi:hypothetical protein
MVLRIVDPNLARLDYFLFCIQEIKTLRIFYNQKKIKLTNLYTFKIDLYKLKLIFHII